MKQVRVIKAYVSEFPEAIRVGAGERLAVDDRETQWPGWVWCRSASGAEGWVPSAYVERDGSSGIMRRDYDATELTVAVGDRLEVIEDVSSWCLCQTADGQVGWVPCENVERV